MGGRKWMIGLALILVLAFAYDIATRVMIARAVLSPHATRTQILLAVLHSPYQTAAPSYSLRNQVHGFFTPTVVHAQIHRSTPSPCGYMKSQSQCNPNCTSGCFCPDCLNLSGDNCTIYHCVVSTKQSDICDDTYTECSNCQNTDACTK